jgi:hypothetical protein
LSGSDGEASSEHHWVACDFPVVIGGKFDAVAAEEIAVVVDDADPLFVPVEVDAREVDLPLEADRALLLGKEFHFFLDGLIPATTFDVDQASILGGEFGKVGHRNG